VLTLSQRAAPSHDSPGARSKIRCTWEVNAEFGESTFWSCFRNITYLVVQDFAIVCGYRIYCDSPEVYIHGVQLSRAQDHVKNTLKKFGSEWISCRRWHKIVRKKTWFKYHWSLALLLLLFYDFGELFFKILIKRSCLLVCDYIKIRQKKMRTVSLWP